MLKPTDKAIYRVVSELSGRSESEHIGSLDTPKNLRAELVEKQRKQNLELKLNETVLDLSGVIVAAW